MGELQVVADGNRHAMMSQDSPLRPYMAIVWTNDPEKPGQRLEVFANSLDDAKSMIKAQFDEEITMSLWNEEDANRPR